MIVINGCINWKLGNLPFDYKEIYSIVASDGELKFIRNHIKNVPIHDGEEVVWFGDIAKFIAYALGIQSYSYYDPSIEGYKRVKTLANY